MSRTEEIVNIVTAWRFIAMLGILLVALMGHYGQLDPEVAKYVQNFFIGFIGVNTTGKITDKIVEAVKSTKNLPTEL